MKALFSTFGRKSGAHGQTPAASSSRKEGSSTSTLYADQTRNPLRYSQADNHIADAPVRIGSFANGGGDIGAAPVSALPDPGYSKEDRHGDVSHDKTVTHASDWGAKLTGTLRASTRKKKERGRLSKHLDPDAASPAGLSHPPSSFRDPSASGLPGGSDARPYDEVFVQPQSHLEAPSFSGQTTPSRSSSLRRKSPQPTAQPQSHTALNLRALKHPPSASRSPQRPMSSRADQEQPLERASSTSSRKSAFGLLEDSSRRRGSLGTTSSNGVISAPISHSAAPTMTSEELAAKLNELAVSNADGLLSDDEYRTLRAGLFQKLMQLDGQAMQVPQEPNLAGMGVAASIGDSARAPSINNADVPPQAPVHASPKALSHRQSTLGSVSSFFKRGSTTPQKQTSSDSYASQHNDLRATYNSAPSLLSSNDGHSARPGSSLTHAKSSRASTLSRFGNGSHSRRLQAEAMAAEMERSYSAARSAKSLRAQSVDHTPVTSPSVRSGRGRNGSGGPLQHASSFRSTATKAGSELSDDAGPGADLFGVDYGEKSSAEIRAEIAVVQAEGARMLDTFDGLEQTVIGKYRLDYATLKRAVDEVKAGHPHGSAGGKGPPSSYRPPRANSLPRRADGHSMMRLQSNGSAASALEDPGPPDEEVEALKAELREVLDKKARVVARYDERTAFLRSKLRSATIREGLLK